MRYLGKSLKELETNKKSGLHSLCACMWMRIYVGLCVGIWVFFSERVKENDKFKERKKKRTAYTNIKWRTWQE